MKICDRINNLKVVEEDVDIQVAMGKVLSQMNTMQKKVSKEEAAVYAYFKGLLLMDKASVIKGAKKEL